MLRLCQDDIISPKSAIEIIELITNVPAIQREVLEKAKEMGVIQKEEGNLVLLRKTLNEKDSFYPRIKKTKCDGKCQKCGRSITSCHIIFLSPQETIGPFGSDCIKKMGLI